MGDCREVKYETAQSTKKPQSGFVLGNMYDRKRARAQAYLVLLFISLLDLVVL